MKRMTKVKFSSTARADLKEIGRFSKREFGLSVAEKYLLGFDEAFDLLRSHPEAGPVREAYGAEMRCLMHRRHRILYKLDGRDVRVVAIIHHARNLKRSLLK